jgi:hypothetical protein
MGARRHRDRTSSAGRTMLLAVAPGLGLLAFAPLLGVMYGGVLACGELADLALRW